MEEGDTSNSPAKSRWWIAKFVTAQLRSVANPFASPGFQALQADTNALIELMLSMRALISFALSMHTYIARAMPNVQYARASEH